MEPAEERAPFLFLNRPASLSTRHTLDGATATTPASSIMKVNRRARSFLASAGGNPRAWSRTSGGAQTPARVPHDFFAPSVESVGDLRLEQLAKCMIERDFCKRAICFALVGTRCGGQWCGQGGTV